MLLEPTNDMIESEIRNPIPQQLNRTMVKVGGATPCETSHNKLYYSPQRCPVTTARHPNRPVPQLYSFVIRTLVQIPRKPFHSHSNHIHYKIKTVLANSYF